MVDSRVFCRHAGKDVARTDGSSLSKADSDRDNLKNAEDHEVRGIGGQQSVNAAGIKCGCKMGVQNAFTAQLKLAHPADCLVHRGLVWLDQADRRILKQFLNPIECVAHRKRGSEPFVIRTYVKKFINDQGRKYKLHSSLGFVLDCSKSFCVSRMIGEGKLDEDIAIQANHCLPNISSAKSA